MPDVALRRPLAVGAALFDANGQPQTSGASGTLTVVDPDGATVHSGAAAHLGNGIWGRTVPATAHTTAGVHTWTLSGVSDGAGSGDQIGMYAVGVVTPDQLTLWDIYRAVATQLRDGRQGRASSVTVNTLVDGYYTYGTTNNFVGAHLLLPYTVTPTDTNPARVYQFAPATGTYSFRPSLSGSQTAGRYIIGGLRGFTHEQKLDAILGAIRTARPRVRFSDERTLVGVRDTFEYAIPDAWTSISGVYLQPSTTPYEGDWSEVAPIYWGVRRDRRLLTLDFTLTNLTRIRIDGRFMPPPPQFYGSYVDVPGDYVIARALERLCAESPDQKDQRMVAYWAAKAEELEPTLAREPNEIEL